MDNAVRVTDYVMGVCMRALILCAALALTGCVAPAPALVLKPITDAEIAPYRAARTAWVTGQAFLRQQGGGVVTCAGSSIFLMPNIAATRQMLADMKAGARGQGGMKLDTKLRGTGAEGTCNAQGNFRLGPVAPGRYILLTEVSWTVGYARQGGVLRRDVSVKDGETIEVMMTEREIYAK